LPAVTKFPLLVLGLELYFAGRLGKADSSLQVFRQLIDGQVGHFPVANGIGALLRRANPGMSYPYKQSQETPASEYHSDSSGTGEGELIFFLEHSVESDWCQDLQLRPNVSDAGAT